ncbi:MAG: hypothetical protein RL328_2320 [Acidobacteriota bacterium]
MKTFIATLALASALGGFSAPSHADRLDDVAKHLSEFTGYELERHGDEYVIHVSQNAHWILGFPRGMVGPRTILVVRVYFEPTNERSQSPEAINVYNAEMVFLKAYLDKDYGFIFERVELAGTRTPTDLARAITEALDDFDVAARLMPEYATESKDNAEVRRVAL